MGWPAIVAIVMMVVAAGVGAYTSVQSGKAQKKSARMQADYQQSQAEAAAKQAKVEAQWAEYRVAVNEQQSEAKKRATKAQALETMAKARLKKGVSSDSGSLLDEEIRGINELGYTMDLIDWETEIETANIRKQKSGYEYQSSLYENQADWASTMGQFGAETATSQARMNAGASLLAGGAQVASTYSNRNSVQRVEVVK